MIILPVIAIFLIGLVIGAIGMLAWIVGDFDSAVGELFSMGQWYP